MNEWMNEQTTYERTNERMMHCINDIQCELERNAFNCPENKTMQKSKWSIILNTGFIFFILILRWHLVAGFATLPQDLEKRRNKEPETTAVLVKKTQSDHVSSSSREDPHLADRDALHLNNTEKHGDSVTAPERSQATGPIHSRYFILARNKRPF